ncbi:ABC1 kinase family protein [uncultured Mycobacterium sp.]|uniref:ABC1 kinase family protein n=1 Tax=uncultured Mycobacterium sp. TaxID=171292 RepID=UPI0035CA7F50
MADNPVPRGRIRRTMPLAGFAARAAGGRMVAALREKAGEMGAVERFHERTAERYSELLGHSKGVLMNAGQLLSMVDASAIGNGGFSPYQAALTRLQADAPPMDGELAKDVLQADLGRSLEEVFAEFSDEPMAAASIGQVHHAVLHDGREVAVKIQYPGAAEAIRDDLANTELLATFFRFAVSASGTAMQPDFRQMTREIAAQISQEIDYRHESANIAAFSELYHDHPFIRVPEVIDEACGDRVLTMTYLDGMGWGAAQQANQDLKNTWAEVVVRFAAGSYRHANLFNADPHPGNYRFRTDGRVGFVDFGCVKVLPERQRRQFVGMLRAAVDGRKHDMCDLMDELGYFAGGSTLSADEAYQWMTELAYEVLAPQPVTASHETSQRAIRALIDLRPPDHPVRRLSVPDDLVFFPRINLVLNPIIAALGATLYARSIVDDLDGVAEPLTPLGKQHNAWVRRRGLPYGLEPHDHP